MKRATSATSAAQNTSEAGFRLWLCGHVSFPKCALSLLSLISHGTVLTSPRSLTRTRCFLKTLTWRRLILSPRLKFSRPSMKYFFTIAVSEFELINSSSFFYGLKVDACENFGCHKFSFSTSGR